MLKPYPAKNSIRSQIRVATPSSRPRSTAPAMNFSRCASMTDALFFPIALRSTSASPIVNPARSLAMRMTCSW